MATGPVCIRRTSTLEEANIIVAWLEEHDVEATIVDRDNPGVLAFGLTDTEGIAICVADEAAAERAKTLLAQHDRERDRRSATDASAGTVEVTCEQCGHTTTFSGDARRSVQECPNCGNYLDVTSQKDE